MWSLETTLVEVAFRGVNQIANRGRVSLHRWPAAVPGSGRCVHLVMAGQQWDHVPPRVSRHGHAVQQHQG
jgi:hypothetical protein